MSYIGFVDILSIIPSLIVGTDMTSIRVFRLMRLFRLMKLTKYLSGIDLIINVINKNRGKLLISLIFIFMMFTFSSILMYSVEYEAQPEVFSSIPKTAWWAIATMTTVGYGDMYPITSIGKVVAGFVSIVSLFIFAIPTSILASGFVEISSIKVKEESNDTDIYDISQMD
jgi:voltage-gated potassium channel